MTEKMMEEGFVSYQDNTEGFLARVRCEERCGHAPTAQIAEDWLCEFNESRLSEADRFNAIMPVIKWCAEKNVMTEWFRDELWLYYESYLNGKLAEDFKDYTGKFYQEGFDTIDLDEDKAIAFRDLKETYKLVYGTEELVDEA